MKKKMTQEERIKYFLDNFRDKTYEEMAKPMGFKAGESVRGWARLNKMPNKKVNSQSLRSGIRLSELVAKAIKNKKMSIVELADRFNVPPKKVKEAVVELQKQKFIVDNFDDGICMSKTLEPEKTPKIITGSETEFRIGAIADTHIGSKYERLDVLEAIYDRFADYGVKEVFLAGNWIDGEARFNKYDIYVHGVNEQIRNFIEKFPKRNGITNHILSGDDHEGWYVQREHINVGQLMEDEARRAGRNDLIDLGYMERDIVFKRIGGQSIVRIIHGGGGSTYAISYTAQKYAESLQGGEKPQIVIMGHYHKYDVSYPREIYMVQPGCTQDQTPFMRKRKLQAMIGGVVLWIKQDDKTGIFTSIKHEFLPFYNKKYYEYKW